MSDRVLVTGATGFIGRALVKSLRDAGLEVVALGSADGDVRNRETFARYSGSGIAGVIHLAGRSFVPESWTDPAAFMDVNFMGTARVLEFCRLENASLVFLSAYVYGIPDRLPINEEAPVRPNNPYAQSKQLAEQVCRFYAEQLHVPVTVLRTFNVYGPGQGESFLIPSIMRQLCNGEVVEVLDLEPRRDWVFVTDVVSAIMAARGRVAGYNIYNIGSGVSHSVAEVIRIAQKVAGSTIPVRSAATRRLNEIHDVVADIAKARRELGWSPVHDLDSGLRKCWLSLREAI